MRLWPWRKRPPEDLSHQELLCLLWLKENGVWTQGRWVFIEEMGERSTREAMRRLRRQGLVCHDVNQRGDSRYMITALGRFMLNAGGEWARLDA